MEPDLKSEDLAKRRYPQGYIVDDRKKLKLMPSIKVLVPDKDIPYIIGENSQTIMSLSSTTGTIIKISHPGGYFPGTKDRIVHLIGGYDSLIKCMEELLNINEYIHGDSLQSTTNLSISESAIGCIIGKKGSIVREINESSNSVVKIITNSEYTTLPENKLQIDGYKINRMNAIAQIIGRLLEKPEYYAYQIESVDYPQHELFLDSKHPAFKPSLDVPQNPIYPSDVPYSYPQASAHPFYTPIPPYDQYSRQIPPYPPPPPPQLPEYQRPSSKDAATRTIEVETRQFEKIFGENDFYFEYIRKNADSDIRVESNDSKTIITIYGLSDCIDFAYSIIMKRIIFKGAGI